MVKAVLRYKKETTVPARDAKPILGLIRKGLFLKKQIEKAKALTEENNVKLMPFAEELASSTGLKTATFKSSDGSVTVKFTDEISYEEKDLPAIKRALGPLFSQMFYEQKFFAVNQEDIPEIREKLGPDFKRLVSEQATTKHTPALKDLIANGDNQTAKTLRKYIFIEPKKPQVAYAANEKEAAAVEAKTKPAA